MGNKFKGMTVNERLYVSGLMDDFDKAVEKKNIDKVREILFKVELVDESINPILESLGLIPKDNKLHNTGISGMKLDNSSIENVSISKKNSDDGDVGIFDSEMKDSKISDIVITDEKANEEKKKPFLKLVGIFLLDNIVKIIVGIIIVFLCVKFGLKK